MTATRTTLIFWVAVTVLILAGFTAWVLDRNDVCIAGQVIDYQSRTVYPVECS